MEITLTIPAESLVLQAAPPDMLSQHNVEAAIGIPPRVYLDTIRVPGFPVKVHRLGKFRLVNRVEFLTWLTSARPKAARRVQAETDGDPEYDAFLDGMGLERKR